MKNGRLDRAKGKNVYASVWFIHRLRKSGQCGGGSEEEWGEDQERPLSSEVTGSDFGFRKMAHRPGI